MELQPLVGLGQQLVHGVGEALVVLVVHPFPLPRLKGTREDDLERKIKNSSSTGRERKVGGRGADTTKPEFFHLNVHGQIERALENLCAFVSRKARQKKERGGG